MSELVIFVSREKQPIVGKGFAEMRKKQTKVAWVGSSSCQQLEKIHNQSLKIDMRPNWSSFHKTLLTEDKTIDTHLNLIPNIMLPEFDCSYCSAVGSSQK